MQHYRAPAIDSESHGECVHFKNGGNKIKNQCTGCNGVHGDWRASKRIRQFCNSRVLREQQSNRIHHTHVRATHGKDKNSNNEVDRIRNECIRACTVSGWIDRKIQRRGATINRCAWVTYTGACQHHAHHNPATSMRWEDAS